MSQELREIILYTTGVHWSCTDPVEVAREVKAEGIRISVVGFGGKNSHARAIASFGHYRDIADVSAFSPEETTNV